jgi:8-oxo-dGTP pyrophosphatase MutT (NUDIX family)
MTLFTIVDENDIIIWYKTKEDIDYSKEFNRNSGLRLINSHWEILIAQRAQSKRFNPGKRWPAVAGTVEQGETYEDNMIKEMQEELWLINIPITLWPKIKHEWASKYIWQRFLAQVEKDISAFKVLRREIAAIKWISRKELIEDAKIHPENYLAELIEMANKN